MQISKATSKKEMRKVEEKGYGDEIIDAGDNFLQLWYRLASMQESMRQV